MALRRGFEVLDIGLSGFFQHIGQGGLLPSQLRGAFAVLRRSVVLGHAQAHLLGQVL